MAPDPLIPPKVGPTPTSDPGGSGSATLRGEFPGTNHPARHLPPAGRGDTMGGRPPKGVAMTTTNANGLEANLQGASPGTAEEMGRAPRRVRPDVCGR